MEARLEQLQGQLDGVHSLSRTLYMDLDHRLDDVRADSGRHGVYNGCAEAETP